MGDNQRADVVNGEINREIRCAGTLGFLLPLKEATVDQDTSGGVLLGAKSKLVAGASNARGGAVVGYIYHGQQSFVVCSAPCSPPLPNPSPAGGEGLLLHCLKYWRSLKPF